MRFDAEMVEERGELLLLPLPCGLPYAFQQRHRAFAAGMEELASVPDAGGRLLARVRLSQPSAVGRITAATGAPQ
jgi:hypothetical protein